jgi:LysM repeat protein
MSLLHGVLRAATAALLIVIAVLVYVNYFRGRDADLSGLRSEVIAPPELPKLAAGPETAPPAAPTSAIPNSLNSPVPPATTNVAGGTNLNAPTETARPAQLMRENSAPVAGAPRQPRAEVIDESALAEVVELPPSNNPHAAPPSSPQAQAQAQAQSQMTRTSEKPVGKRTHVVQPGESLWLISKKMYGNAELYSKIADANGLTAKDRVRAGQVLVIPEPNGPAENILAKATERVPLAEDLADHEDSLRPTPVSLPREEPASMSSTVKLK